MSKMIKEVNVLTQLYKSLSEQDKQIFLTNITLEDNVKKIIQPIIVSCCPHCQSNKFIKHGKIKTNQRYKCQNCSKTFVERTGTVLFQMKKDIETLELYIHCMIEKYSLRKCAKICNISLITAFQWRHKILDSISKVMDNTELEGVVQADETYTRLSFKGSHKNFKLPRLPYKRGTPASKRGISKEQVCITTGVDLNHSSLAKVSNLGRPKIKDLKSVLDGHINSGSILVTDSLNSYKQMSIDMDLEHIAIPKEKHRAGIFNIQMVNNYHSSFKRLLRIFNGVATKYLNNYLAYHNFVNFAKDSNEEKEITLLDLIRRTPCISHTLKISKRPAIPI